MNDGELDLTDVKDMNFEPGEQTTFALKPGDVLVTEGSGSLSTVGASAVWGGELSGTVCFQNTLIRLRPRPSVVDSRFLGWWARAAYTSGQFASIATGASIYHLSSERVKGLPIFLPLLDEQRRIADFLEEHVGRLDELTRAHKRYVALLDERVDSRVRSIVNRAGTPANDSKSMWPLKRLLAKLSRPRALESSDPSDPIVTVFRDGQVVARDDRRSEGFTDVWASEGSGQGVRAGDVVIHGLDGFSGAIGVSESTGWCSPVYHVCSPLDGGDAAFYGRMLRLLALDGYLNSFGGSARERAVDFRNWDRFARVPIPCIPPDEQRSVGDAVRAIWPIRREVGRFNTVLAERRNALIALAVTGQLDVTTARGVAV